MGIPTKPMALLLALSLLLARPVVADLAFRNEWDCINQMIFNQEVLNILLSQSELECTDVLPDPSVLFRNVESYLNEQDFVWAEYQQHAAKLKNFPSARKYTIETTNFQTTDDYHNSLFDMIDLDFKEGQKDGMKLFEQTILTDIQRNTAKEKQASEGVADMEVQEELEEQEEEQESGSINAGEGLTRRRLLQDKGLEVAEGLSQKVVMRTDKPTDFSDVSGPAHGDTPLDISPGNGSGSLPPDCDNTVQVRTPVDPNQAHAKDHADFLDTDELEQEFQRIAANRPPKSPEEEAAEQRIKSDRINALKAKIASEIKEKEAKIRQKVSEKLAEIAAKKSAEILPQGGPNEQLLHTSIAIETPVKVSNQKQTKTNLFMSRMDIKPLQLPVQAPAEPEDASVNEAQLLTTTVPHTGHSVHHQATSKLAMAKIRIQANDIKPVLPPKAPAEEPPKQSFPKLDLADDNIALPPLDVAIATTKTNNEPVLSHTIKQQKLKGFLKKTMVNSPPKAPETLNKEDLAAEVLEVPLILEENTVEELQPQTESEAAETDQKPESETTPEGGEAKEGESDQQPSGENIELADETAEQPAETPEQPADTPEQPADTPDQPEETPEQPTETPEQPAEQPTEAPQEQPEGSTETPEPTPEETPSDAPKNSPPGVPNPDKPAELPPVESAPAEPHEETDADAAHAPEEESGSSSEETDHSSPEKPEEASQKDTATDGSVNLETFDDSKDQHLSDDQKPPSIEEQMIEAEEQQAQNPGEDPDGPNKSKNGKNKVKNIGATGEEEEEEKYESLADFALKGHDSNRFVFDTRAPILLTEPDMFSSKNKMEAAQMTRQGYRARQTVFALQKIAAQRSLGASTLSRMETLQSIFKVFPLLHKCVQRALEFCKPDHMKLLRACEASNDAHCQFEDFRAVRKCDINEQLINDRCYRNCPEGLIDYKTVCLKPNYYQRVVKPYINEQLGKDEERWGETLVATSCASINPFMRPVGPFFCRMTCPMGFKDFGIYCRKPVRFANQSVFFFDEQTSG